MITSGTEDNESQVEDDSDVEENKTIESDSDKGSDETYSPPGSPPPILRRKSVYKYETSGKYLEEQRLKALGGSADEHEDETPGLFETEYVTTYLCCTRVWFNNERLIW